MFDYVPDVFRGQYAETEDEGDRWYSDPDNNKRPPELLPRDEVARAINNEVKAGRGSPQGGVFLDVSKRLPADVIRKKLPSMWHQFKELADVDITAEPMQVGPTCHYVMGGIEVEPDSAATLVPGPVRGRRGRRRHARLEPPRRQLALGPPGLRSPRRAWAPRTTSPGSETYARRSATGSSRPPRPRPSHPSRTTAARTPTRSTTTCSR